MVYTAAQLVAELAALPETAAEGDTLICHASPRDDSRSFAPEPADDDAELLEDVAARRIVFGHTHDGRVEHRRVEYDVAASAARVRALGAWGEAIARRLETARR